jgi:hypothetical protein
MHLKLLLNGDALIALIITDLFILKRTFPLYVVFCGAHDVATLGKISNYHLILLHRA